MIKIEFIELNKERENKLEVYNDTNRVPLSIYIGNNIVRPKSEYLEYLSEDNFVEFWFNKDTKELYEISFISIKNSGISLIQQNEIKYDKTRYSCCRLIEYKNLTLKKEDINVTSTDNSIIIMFYQSNVNYLNFFQITRNCLIGIDNENYLKSIIINNLSKDDISTILDE